MASIRSAGLISINLPRRLPAREMSAASVPKYASRLRGFDGPTVWHEFTPLAMQHKSDNLGQGFPDWETPQFVKDSMDRAVAANFNQYCR